MDNHSVKISEEILKEFDALVKKSGVSQKEFLIYMANFYNINNILEKDIIDPAAYYDSFIA
jgi:metal-responsive CopG/Arc/MetJ family transcriptional regulator